jgi:hypothetical protein
MATGYHLCALQMTFIGAMVGLGPLGRFKLRPESFTPEVEQSCVRCQAFPICERLRALNASGDVDGYKRASIGLFHQHEQLIQVVDRVPAGQATKSGYKRPNSNSKLLLGVSGKQPNYRGRDVAIRLWH